MTQVLSNNSPRVVSGLGDASANPQQSSPDHPPVLHLEQRVYSRALDCVHCGLCLPACPTYTQNGLEADSPRGRIYLMKGLADGKIEPTVPVLEHLDLCLDCRACETACPSGVVYHELLEESRNQLASLKKPTAVDRLVEFMFLHIFTRPTRLKLAMLPARVLQRLGVWKLLNQPGVTKLLPVKIQKMQQMLPPDGPMWESALLERYPAHKPAEKRATVAFFAGCIGSVLFQRVNRQTIELLRHAGCEVLVPKTQGCCGAIHHHAGHAHEAEAMARQNIDVLMTNASGNVDYIVNNISGCGAMLKDYSFLLRDDAKYKPLAESFVKKVRDISELLVELAPPPPSHSIDRTVTYHDACHLAHGQKITSQPRELLRWIPGLKVIPLYESDMCCGAAGTYNLTQPRMARELAERKIRHIQETGARTCVTANVGCAMQIQSEAARLGVDLRVTHPVSLLYEAYFGESL